MLRRVEVVGSVVELVCGCLVALGRLSSWVHEWVVWVLFVRMLRAVRVAAWMRCQYVLNVALHEELLREWMRQDRQRGEAAVECGLAS